MVAYQFWFVVWLRPSKQIRAPLYSMKQKRQRRKIVRDPVSAYMMWANKSFTGYQVWFRVFPSYRHIDWSRCWT